MQNKSEIDNSRQLNISINPKGIKNKFKQTVKKNLVDLVYGLYRKKDQTNTNKETKQQIDEIISVNDHILSLLQKTDTLIKSRTDINNRDVATIATRLVEELTQPLYALIKDKLNKSSDDREIEIDYYLAENIFEAVRYVYFEICENKENQSQEKVLAEFIRKKKEDNDRIEVNSHRRLRRLDSLAGLLELDAKNSVCSAASISSCGLVLSANNSGVMSNNDIAMAISSKLSIVRKFLLSKTNESEKIKEHEELDTYYTENLDILTNDAELECIVSDLQSISYSSQNQNDLKQNLIKLLKTFVLDKGLPYSQDEISSILSGNYKILLPIENQENALQADSDNFGKFSMEEYSCANNNLICNGSINIPGMYSKDIKVKNLHAEQLILYYFKNIINIAEADIGISKACCQDCRKVFEKGENSAYKIRGCSGSYFPNTVLIEEKTTRQDTASSPIKSRSKGSCAHVRSPYKSPGERGEKSGKHAVTNNVNSFFVGSGSKRTCTDRRKLDGTPESSNYHFTLDDSPTSVTGITQVSSFMGKLNLAADYTENGLLSKMTN
ncbi:MAG: hypothetical protein A3E88_06060 [Legionellales bacterium RIFCSPHIGHO2_12_FULL_35_11]|nr:MAG: hypothetical protein A3E88_06060 [Legionellales bacterium RIFCSPHIGHO2_12_FULL_35_11]